MARSEPLELKGLVLNSEVSSADAAPRLTSPQATMLVAGLFAIPLAIVLTIAFVLAGFWWWAGILLGAVLGLAVALYLRATASQRVLSQWNSPAVAHEEMARAQNLLEGLTLTVGATEPELVILNDSALNAMVVAGSSGDVVMCTTGLLEQLGRIELEGVIAELLVRIKSGDAQAATLAAGMVGIPLVDGPMGGLFRHVGAWIVGGQLTAQRDFVADRQAVAVTRYPPGLSSALTIMAAHPNTPTACSAGTDHLWLAPPRRDDALVPTAPLDWRIDVLLEI